jgi:hypothetical protein
VHNCTYSCAHCRTNRGAINHTNPWTNNNPNTITYCSTHCYANTRSHSYTHCDTHCGSYNDTNCSTHSSTLGKPDSCPKCNTDN